jgi:hypothetical protein
VEVGIVHLEAEGTGPRIQVLLDKVGVGGQSLPLLFLNI